MLADMLAEAKKKVKTTAENAKTVTTLPDEQEALREKQQNVDEVTAPVKISEDKPVAPVEADKINPQAKYGDKPGEQRIDVKDMMKPLGSTAPVYDEGGEIPSIPDTAGLPAGRDEAAPSLDTPVGAPQQPQMNKLGAMDESESDPQAEKRKANARNIQNEDDSMDVSEGLPTMKVPAFDEGGDVRMKPLSENAPKVDDGKHQMAVLEQGERVLTPQQNADYMKDQHGFGKIPSPPQTHVTINLPSAMKEDQDMQMKPLGTKQSESKEGNESKHGEPVPAAVSTPAAQPQGLPIMDEGGEVGDSGAATDITPTTSTDDLAQPAAMQPLSPAQHIDKAYTQARRDSINDHMVKAAANDDVVELGKGAIAHNQLDKHELRMSPLGTGLGTPSGVPNAPSPTAAADSMTPTAGGAPQATPKAPGIPAVKSPNLNTPDGYKQQEEALKAKIIDPTATPLESAQAQEKLATLRQNRPMSSRSGIDKFGHILGKIAEPVLMATAPEVEAAIPGSTLNLGMEHSGAAKNVKEAEENQLKEAETSAKANPPVKQEDQARLEMGKLSTMLQDPDISAADRKLAEDRQQVLQAEYPTVLGAPTESKAPKVEFSAGGVPMSVTQGKNSYVPGQPMPPDAQKMMDQAVKNHADEITRKEEPSSQEDADKLNTLYDPDLKRAGLPTGQFTKGMTKDERAATRQALTSSIAQLRAADAAANAAEVAKNKQADAKSQYGTVQMGINKLADPEIVKLYDKPGVGAALANATAETVTHMGAYVPGVGGFTIPTSTLDNMVTRGVISATDASKLVDAYNTGVESAMDFMLIQQGGKIGRGGKSLLEPLFNLLPGPKTVGSKDAMQKLNNFQDVFDIWKRNHPAMSEGVTSYRDKGYVPASQPTATTGATRPPTW